MGLLARSMRQQSQAIAALAERSAGGPVDPLMGLSASSDTATGVRGGAQRERDQQNMAAHPGRVSQRVQAAMRRRLGRSAGAAGEPPDPLLYLERFGGFEQHYDYGQVAWLVAGVLEALWTGQVDAGADQAALLLVALEQSALDNRGGDLAWLLTLQEDIPTSVFTRPQVVGPGVRSFTQLAPQEWITTALAYLREVDTLRQRSSELQQRGGRGRRPRGGRQTPAPAPGDAPPQGREEQEAPPGRRGCGKSGR